MEWKLHISHTHTVSDDDDARTSCDKDSLRTDFVSKTIMLYKFSGVYIQHENVSSKYLKMFIKLMGL